MTLALFVWLVKSEKPSQSQPAAAYQTPAPTPTATVPPYNSPPAGGGDGEGLPSSNNSQGDPFEGPTPFEPIFSGLTGAIPPDPVDEKQPKELAANIQSWEADQDEFGTKLLQRVPAKELGIASRRFDAVVPASQFESDPAFVQWHKSVGGSSVRVRYVGAREIAEADESWAAGETTLSWALLFETTPQGVGEFKCDSCRPLLSAIALQVDKDGNSSVIVPFQALGPFGLFGGYPLAQQAITKTIISKNQSLLTLHDPKTSNGVDSASIRLFRIADARFVEVMDFTYWSDNSKSETCRNQLRSSGCGVFEPRLKWIIEPGMPYFGLSVEEAGLKSDANGNPEPLRTPYILRFNGSYFSS